MNSLDKDALRGKGNRPNVMKIYVQPEQVWFHCPCCDELLEGFLDDPRGVHDVTCDGCGRAFDIPVSADVVID